MKTIAMAVFICHDCDAVTMIQEGSEKLIKDEDDSADGEGVYNPLGFCALVRTQHGPGTDDVCFGTVEYRGTITLDNGVFK